MAKPANHLLLALITAIVLVVSPITTSVAQQSNISSGASLQAAAGAGWASPSGRFAFGFYATDGGLAVGVWLATSPNVTVTWTANRNDTPATSGALQLTYDGRLLWTGADGQDRAVAVPSQPAVSGAMRDDGSFVLYGANGTAVWSTFASSPTDTLVPGQDLAPGAQLISSASATNRATGKYRLANQVNDGNVVMYPVETQDVAAAAYWATGTFQIGFPLTLRLDDTGVLFLVGNDGNYTKNLTTPHHQQPVGDKEEEVFYHVTLDPDGVLRLYRHAVAKGGAWRTEVQWIGPSDRCHVKGACGLNSYCVLDGDGQPRCSCPPGFDYIDAANPALGCTTQTSGDCVDASGLPTSATMAAMANMSWADTPYGVVGAGTSAADCQAACVSDCLCFAVLLDGNDGTCTKQQLPLRYGRAGGSYTLFVRNQQAGEVHGGGNRAAVIALACIGVLTCVSLAALVAAARLLWVNHRRRRRRRTHTALAEADDDGEDEAPSLRSFSYEELERATSGFRDPLGRGAFGTVFRGTLSNSKAVAVKRLEKLSEEGEVEFRREVRAIGRTSHRNLVRLLGFCHEGAHRLLVYDYMSNGSLADLLFFRSNNKTSSPPPPCWADRVGIALDVARGLHYLHDELDSRVIHCDVKPHNILMDASGTAKIADFGLAKLLLPDQTRTFTGVRGTRGYLAPEWYSGARMVTVKADVYSYGVVLLEILTCRRTIHMDDDAKDEEERSSTLMDLAYDWLLRGDVKRVMATDEAVEETDVERLVKVAVWCAQQDPQARPTMNNVILMLQGHLQVPFPPPPASS